MATSRDSPSASVSVSDTSSPSPSTHGSVNRTLYATEADFESFATAEQFSDPFGDVYGVETDTRDLVRGVGDHGDTAALTSSMATSSLVSFPPMTAPVVTPAPPPTLLPSISGELDPFADIIASGRACSGSGKDVEEMDLVAGAFGDDPGSRPKVTAPTLTPASTSSRFDLLWENKSHEIEGRVLSSSTTSRDSARSRATSPGNTSVLSPPQRVAKAATFPIPGTRHTRKTSATDLLSFSPVLTSAPIDPFFGIDDGTSETSTAVPVFENNDMLSTPATSPLSTTFSLAPMSLFASFESLHDGGDTLGLSDATLGTTEDKASPHNAFVRHMTRSFGLLSPSSIRVGAEKDNDGKHEAHSLFNGTTSATLEAASPSRAPSFWQCSSKTMDGFVRVVPGADHLDEADSFAEADLATSEMVPLDDHFAAWSAAVEPTEEEKEDEDGDRKQTGEGGIGDTWGSVAGTSDDYIETACAVNDSSDIGLTKTAKTEDLLDACTTTARCEDGEGFDDSFTNVQMATDVSVIRSAAAAIEFNKCDIRTANLITSGSEDKTRDLRDDIVSDVGACNLDDVAFTMDENVVYRVEQRSVDVIEGPPESRQIGIFLSTSTTADLFAGSASQAVTAFDDVANEESSILHHDAFSTSPVASTDIPIASENREKYAAAEIKKQDGAAQARVAGRDDGFDDFDDFVAAVSPMNRATSMPDTSLLGSPAPPTLAHELPAEDEFGGFVVSTPSSVAANIAPVDDSFGDFAQTVERSDDDDCFGDFGDFEQVLANNEDDFTDFQQSSAKAFEGAEGTDCGDFCPAADFSMEASSSRASSVSIAELSTFFRRAFPADPLPVISVDQPESLTDAKATGLAQESSTGYIQGVYRGMWEEFISAVAATDHKLSFPSGPLTTSAESSVDEEHVDKKTKRASKYLKFVLSEKIQEASRQNGIFTHDSESHQMHVDIAASGDAERMCAALRELQDALFHSSVNDAMMRIAKQAAISAKAKIAEQAAQQHANSRGGSLFFTTRHLLSRGGNSGGTHDPGSSGADSKADHAVSDTPTGASVQKFARFSHATGHSDFASSHRGTNREDRVSDGSDHTGHSSGSDSEATSGVESQTRSSTLSNGGSSNGGLMKKFQDRFSFASSRHRPRFVSLRRKGQSGEEVCRMELNLDAISGGLDEVKWKCALFLYDVEEVTHVAPSQICIVAYPSKQPLSGKTDRSALTKLVKPGTIWTIDIGASNSDMMNEW